MPDNFKDLLSHSMPFMVAAGSGADKLNITRMVEALIIAGVVGFGAWFMIIPELKTEFKYIARDVNKLEMSLHTMQAEIKAFDDKVDQIQLDAARGSQDRFTRTDFNNWRAGQAD